MEVLERDGYRCRLRYDVCIGTATIADHKQAVKLGGAEFDLANGQAACEPCHKVKTQAEAQAARPRRRRQPEQHPNTRSNGGG
ncbi:MAG TPA: HNH endonuclease [Nocardioidaceae bacterium]|nr:HNH endonuclease [Nocardioidaceae bacterium]